jgi:hypothetical protein
MRSLKNVQAEERRRRDRAGVREEEEHMRRSRRMIGRALWSRAGVVLLGALVVAGCASAVAIHVPQAGPDTAGLEALARLPAPGGDSVLK